MKPVFKLLKLLHLCLIGMGMFFTIFSIFMYIIAYFYPTLNKTIPVYCQHIMMRITICLISIIYLYLYENKGIKRLFKPTYNGTILIIYTISLQCLMACFVLLWNSIKATLWNVKLEALLYLDNLTCLGIFGIVQMVFFAALCEELLFRGILQRLLEELSGSLFFATVVSALVFGLFHICAINFDNYFIMGSFFSLLYNKTNHILYPIIAHMVHNLLAIFIISLGYNNVLKVFIGQLSICTRIGLMVGCIVSVYGLLTRIVDRQPLDYNQ